ncbi:MAG: hypothetical protein ACLUIX_07875, partial [Oscillospiraceae bacterium]
FLETTSLHPPQAALRRFPRNDTVQGSVDFIGLLKILSYAKPVIPRPVRRLVVGIRSLFAGFLFRSSGCFSFVGSVPPAAHFSHQLEKWAKAHTIVSADFQPRCGVKTGTLLETLSLYPPQAALRRFPRNDTVQGSVDFIGPLKILYAKPVIPRPVRRLVVESVPSLQVFSF